jgi:chromosome segregation protein
VAAAAAAVEAASAERAAADAERDQLRADLLEAERQRGGGASRLAELERAAQAAALEAQRQEDELVAIGRERDLALESLPTPVDEEVTVAPDAGSAELVDAGAEAIVEELSRVRRTLSQIGSVNPFAIDEHRELSGRLETLVAQDADLAAAASSTEELIGRLDAEIAEQFNAAFVAIGAKFEEFCRLLFAGGSASLQMSDGEGEAAGGIEIAVQPPGKRLQRLAMLSGGERSLAGVALLFAMLSVNPVPFCILDEVDAALDEANIGRFADALRLLAQTIDFVVITHNRATIETADTIYGVTMTDAAVSRLLSLRLADVPVEVAAG